jgi:hypothetical protein
MSRGENINGERRTRKLREPKRIRDLFVGPEYALIRTGMQVKIKAFFALSAGGFAQQFSIGFVGGAPLNHL